MLLPSAAGYFFVEVTSLEFYFGDTRARDGRTYAVPGRHLHFTCARGYVGNAASPSWL